MPTTLTPYDQALALCPPHPAASQPPSPTRGEGFRALIFLFALFTLAISSQNANAGPAGCATSEPALRTALEARYEKLSAANLARDGEALAALLAPDFSGEDVSGKRSNAAKTIEAMLAHPRYFRETSFTTVLSIRPTETGAIVERRLETERVKKILAGMVTRLRSIEVATDNWVCREDEWLWQRATTDQLDLDLDGVHVRRVREGM